jgi:hypothetical protein
MTGILNGTIFPRTEMHPISVGLLSPRHSPAAASSDNAVSLGSASHENFDETILLAGSDLCLTIIPLHSLPARASWRKDL